MSEPLYANPTLLQTWKDTGQLLRRILRFEDWWELQSAKEPIMVVIVSCYSKINELSNV